MASLWDAYVNAEVTHDFSAFPEAVVRRLDDAERMVREKFGISAAHYVMANETHGRSAKLGDIIAAVMLHETEAAAAAERERIARLAAERAPAQLEVRSSAWWADWFADLLREDGHD